jgi:hypothetical protein
VAAAMGRNYRPGGRILLYARSKTQARL